MTDHIVTRSTLFTLIITLNICAFTTGPDAGIRWWILTYLAVYPFTHLAWRHLNNRHR